jgi:DNA-directed RNA polymerase specialized sigma24 family protein
MSIGSKLPRLADQLREADVTDWRQVENDVMPRVLGALHRRFGPGRQWHDLEGFARSAQRAAWRLLVQGRYDPLEELESLEQLEGWLVLVASRKYSDALRRAGRETTHAPDVYRHMHDRAGLDNLGEQAAAAVIGELERCLEDETDRAVFRAKLEEKSEAEISLQLRCSTRKVRGVWQRIRQRMARCSQVL